MTGALEQARAIADAVLYEGYLLYPYRASAAKNKVRWQWGVLMPPAYAATGTGERAGTHSELLAEPADAAVLHVRLRFLQLQARIVEVDGAEVPSVTVAGTEHTTFDEAVEREVDAVFEVASLRAGPRRVSFVVPGGEDVERLSAGVRVLRRREALRGEVLVSADALPGPFGGLRLTLVAANRAGWPARGAGRPAALRHALIAAHLLVSLSGGHFLSLLDPPEWASVVAKECRNDGMWPVLVGEADRRDAVLCSPIILYDFPAIAEQSAGNLFDGTEIDEILTLRTMTLTDEEKRAARATDERAAELIDRVDNLPPELLDRLHGTVRYLRSVTGEDRTGGPTVGSAPAVTARPQVPWWDPGADASVSPETDSVVVAGVAVAKGSRVRLAPGRRADAHDMFLAGRTAVVQAVLLDVDGERHLAVTLEDDLGAELYAAHGRYRYFGVDEVEPL